MRRKVPVELAAAVRGRVRKWPALTVNVILLVFAVDLAGSFYLREAMGVKLLDDYRTLREERLKGASRTKVAASTLVVIALQKRLLSSIEAFASTLRVHRRTLEKAAGKEEGKAPSKPVAEANLSLPILLDAPDADALFALLGDVNE